mgnify:CR=1 FL=1
MQIQGRTAEAIDVMVHGTTLVINALTERHGARTALITGMYPSALGAEHMRSLVPLPRGAKLSAQWLREAGYYCTNNAKEDYNVSADGRVIVVEETTDPYRNVPALKISVFMNVFNVHSQRSPVNGMVNEIRYFPGAFVNAALAKASLENERNAMLMKTDTGAEITVVQIAGLVARRILCYSKVGDHLKVGQRYGFIRFGSRLDVYLPPGSRPQVTLGDKVSAGKTVLASL